MLQINNAKPLCIRHTVRHGLTKYATLTFIVQYTKKWETMRLEKLGLQQDLAELFLLFESSFANN